MVRGRNQWPWPHPNSVLAGNPDQHHKEPAMMQVLGVGFANTSPGLGVWLPVSAATQKW